MDEIPDHSFDRREFLSNTATAGGLALFSSSSTASTINTVQLAEIGIKNTMLDPPKRNLLIYEVICASVPYTVNVDEKTVDIRKKELSKHDRSVLENKEKVMYAGQFLPDGSDISEQYSTQSAVVDLSSHLQPIEAVRLAEPARLPNIQASLGQSMRINTGRTTTQIGPGQRGQHVLDTMNTEVVIEESHERHDTDSYDVPNWKLGTKIERRRQNLSIIPELDIRNYGEMEIRYV